VFEEMYGIFEPAPAVGESTPDTRWHVTTMFPPVDEARLRSTDKADVWAEEFAKVFPEIDQGTMIAWFANCAENAKDIQAKRNEVLAEPWTPNFGSVGPPTDSRERIEAMIRQAIGSASMCWEDLDRAGIYQDDQANRVADGVIDWLWNQECL
jgi:hypothetical protein